MFALVSYGVFHASKGAGSHVIRLTHPGCWSNHASNLYAPLDASATELLETILFESRAKIGVTGYWPDGRLHEKARTLAQAIAGGDAVEVYRWDAVHPDAERIAYEWDTRQIGKEYDAPGLGGFIPISLIRDRALRQQQRQYDAKWWCSEKCYAQTMKRGLPALQNVVPFQIDPEWHRTSPLKTFVFGAPDNFPHIVKS